jgi:hypothetical protein
MLAVAAFVAVFLAACGGSDDEGSDEPDAPAASQSSNADAAGSDDAANDDADDAGESDAEDGSDDADGGDGDAGDDDNDSGRIQDIGEPASPEERKAMIEAVTSYFGALADKDPAGACEWLATATIEELERLFEQSETDGDCATFLQHAASVFSGKDAPDFGAIEFSRFRVDDDRGIAIYKVPKRPRSFIVTMREDEGWRVAGIDGTPLP